MVMRGSTQNPDGAGITDNGGIFKVKGIYSLNLVSKAKDNTSVYLDANTYFPNGSDFQVILYKKTGGENQKWKFEYDKTDDFGNDLYLIKSQIEGPRHNFALTFRDKLILEEANEDLAQRWLVKWTREKQWTILWAGDENNFVLQADENALATYSNQNPPDLFLKFDTFNNLPTQSWIFR